MELRACRKRFVQHESKHHGKEASASVDGCCTVVTFFLFCRQECRVIAAPLGRAAVGFLVVDDEFLECML